MQVTSVGVGTSAVSDWTSQFVALMTRGPVESARLHGATCVHMCYKFPMGSSISVRDLRKTVSEVLRRVEGGERLP